MLKRILHWLLRLLPLRFRRALLLVPYDEPQRRLLAARRSPGQVQRAALRRIIENNRRTEFGRAHAFDQIQDPAAFAARVPLRAYAELEPYIQRQRRGESDVLVEGALVGFALSGGSRGRPRALPVTAAGLEHWLWLEDLLEREAIARRPEVAGGVVLHLLPVHQQQVSRTALPLLPMPVLVEHLGRGSRRLPGAVAPFVFTIPDEDTRFYVVLRLALPQRVRMLRAGSPGSLTLLAEHLERLGPKLCADVEEGRIDPPGELPEEVRRRLPVVRPDRERGARLRRALERDGRLDPRAAWPELAVLCCPTGGPARPAAARLGDRFGELLLLDPGYRAAEAAISLPFAEEPGGLVAVGGQFLEFLPPGGGRTLMPEELRVGERYQPVVTGPSGLYRYLMDDITEVTEMQQGLPRLALAGRARCRLRLDPGNLGEDEVREAVVEACRACSVSLGGFTGWLQPIPPATEAAASSPPPAGWLSRLLRRASAATKSQRPPAPSLAVALEPVDPIDQPAAERLAHALDSELGRRSDAYDQQRTDGRLGPPLVLVVRPGTFARRSRRRLADGASDGHAPVPALSDDAWVLDSEEVLLQV
jgi:hypothetical protein